jgi:hypothetical protein
VNGFNLKRMIGVEVKGQYQVIISNICNSGKLDDTDE